MSNEKADTKLLIFTRKITQNNQRLLALAPNSELGASATSVLVAGVAVAAPNNGFAIVAVAVLLDAAVALVEGAAVAPNENRPG